MSVSVEAVEAALAELYRSGSTEAEQFLEQAQAGDARLELAMQLMARPSIEASFFGANAVFRRVGELSLPALAELSQRMLAAAGQLDGPVLEKVG